VYHWYFVRFVRIACCGFGMLSPRGTAFVLKVR